MAAPSTREEFAEQLRETAHQGKAVANLLEHDGFKAVRAALDGYRKKCEDEFKAGTRDAPQYRADLNVLDWVDGTIQTFINHGKQASTELQQLEDARAKARP